MSLSDPLRMSMTDGPGRRRHPHVRRSLGLGLLGAALLSAAACGSDSVSDSVGTPTGPTPPAAPAATVAPSSTVTATVEPPAPTTSAAPTSAAPVAAPGTTVTRPTATLDDLVGVDGARLHIRCTGSGTTTVLLIAGFEGGSDGWAAVEPALAESSRVCSYDRPGMGTSDPATATQTFTSQANDLHSLLTSAGEPGPYVVVGHSFGGAEAVTFASMFAGEVTGVVLVDASPVTWPAALCSVPDDGSDGALIVREVCAGLSDPNGNREHLDAFSAFADVSGIASLGSLPITVITAVERELPDIAPSEVARLTDVWNQGQQDWAGLSTASRVVSVDHTGHHIEIEHPDLVIDEIDRLLP